MALNSEQELVATWRALVEVVDGKPGDGVRMVRALLAAADGGRRGDGYFEQAIRRPKHYEVRPAPPHDANAGQPQRPRLTGTKG